MWQRQDSNLVERIHRGLTMVGNKLGRPPITLVYVSEVDCSTLKRGATQSHKGGTRVCYRDLCPQLQGFATRVQVAACASHEEVCVAASRCLTDIKQAGAIPVFPPDLVASSLDLALLDAAAVAPVTEAEVARSGTSVDVAGQQRNLLEAEAAPSGISVDAARKQRKALFGSWSLPRAPVPDMGGDEMLLQKMRASFENSPVCWVTGVPGSGKSTRGPMAALKALEAMGCGGRGAVLVLQKKLAAYTLFDYFVSEACGAAGMARVWNGDHKMWPAQQPFLMLTTPTSFYHRLKHADAWADVGLLVLDEVHNKDGLTHLILAFVLYLIQQQDPRVRHLKVLLVTATPGAAGGASSSGETPACATPAAIREAVRLLEEAGVPSSSVEVEPGISHDAWKRIPLFEVVEQPRRWSRMTVLEQASEACVLMTDWLWREKWESAVLLLIVAGEKEMMQLRNFLYASEALERLSDYEIFTLSGETLGSDVASLKERTTIITSLLLLGQLAP